MGVQITQESPVILKSVLLMEGTAKIEFNRDIYLPKEIYNLTSENGGEKYFNVTLVMHEANLEEYAERNK
jgi:hypothetical protein